MPEHQWFYHGYPDDRVWFCCYEQMGICNDRPFSCIMFISSLHNRNITWVICSKHLIDQRNNQLRHFLQHCSENIIKYGVICHLIHLSWLLVIVRFCILIMFSDVFLFPDASHLWNFIFCAKCFCFRSPSLHSVLYFLL